MGRLEGQLAAARTRRLLKGARGVKRRSLFAIALLAYPRAFRRRFGDEMRDDFRRGTLRHWRRASSADTCVNGLAERGVGDRAMGVLPERRLHTCTSRQAGTSCSSTRFAPTSGTRIRLAIKTPVFTTLTILALALGIGATTAIFAVVNGVLLRALPYRDDARLVNVWSYNTTENRPRNPMSPANFLDFQKMNTTLDGLEGYFTFVTPAQMQTDAAPRSPTRCSSPRTCSTCSAAPPRSAACSRPAKRAPSSC